MNIFSSSYIAVNFSITYRFIVIFKAKLLELKRVINSWGNFGVIKRVFGLLCESIKFPHGN